MAVRLGLIVRLGLALIMLLAITSAAWGQGSKPEVLVMPVGDGDGLYPSVRVAWAIATMMNKERKGHALLAYPFNQFPPADRQAKRRADRLLKKAHDSFQMMEFDKVEDWGKKVLKTYKELLKSHQGVEDYLETLHLMAAAAMLDGKQDEAFNHMNDAIVFDPRPPEKRKFNPQVQDLYKQVKIEPRGTGVVNLGSMPRALVWFNNRLHGAAQGKFKLRPGLYLVRVYRPGYSLFQRWFRVRENQARDLMVTLKRDDSPEPVIIEQLRSEAIGANPGTAVSQVMIDHGASQLVMVTANSDCTEQRCLVAMHWAQEGNWIKHEQGIFSGKGAPLALQLLGREERTEISSPAALAPILPGERICTLDNQCGFNEICRNGQCVEPPKPLIKKWWFWTAIGVAAAATAVAIVVPLSRPPSPVIEVR